MKAKPLLGFIIFLLFVSQWCFASSERLSFHDVRPTMNEMLSYHVEFKEMSSLIIKRSFKVFIDQFDSEKIYLLKDDIKPFLELNDQQLNTVIQSFNEDRFPNYKLLNDLIRKSILRSRKWREEFERELILKTGEIETISPGESYFHFAGSKDQLKERIRKQLIRFLLSEKRYSNATNWTPERRQKIFKLLEKRLQRMENSYLQDGVKGEHFLALHILKSLAKSLDAHTSYFSPEEAYEMRTSLEKQFEGVGVVLREGVDGVIITEMVKGGPAERCGQITPGDLLVEIDGKSIENSAYEDVLIAMKGEGKREIELGFMHVDSNGDSQLKRVSLKREKIVMQEERLQYSVEPFADGLIGKLDLPSFYESSDHSSCEADIRAAIKNLKRKGKLYGIILDLRENSGGFLNQAVKVAGLFISSGVIVISKYSQGEIQYLRDIDGRVYFDGPVLVLTSKGSASAAEIVAQALQDYGTALIAGDERTYGKGTIQYQTVTDEGAKAFFKVTVGKYYTVSGKSTQIEGVKADIVVPTQYSHYNIGERYLEYPLKNDRVPSAYSDPLSDLDRTSKGWFQKNYLPNLQKKLLTWQKMLPILTTNSSFRLKNDKNFIRFLEALEKPHDPEVFSLQNNWGTEDLQMTEAVNILKDMLLLNLESKANSATVSP